MVKNLPAKQEMQESWIQSLGQEDPLEEAMATHSSILVWKIPWTEEPGRAIVHGVVKDLDMVLSYETKTVYQNQMEKFKCM